MYTYVTTTILFKLLAQNPKINPTDLTKVEQRGHRQLKKAANLKRLVCVLILGTEYVCVWVTEVRMVCTNGKVCMCLSIKIISLYVCSYFCFPLISIVEELLLVVEQFFMGFSGKLKVRTLNKYKCNLSTDHHCRVVTQGYLTKSTVYNATEQNHTHLYYGIHRTCLLTETTVDAFGHVNVIASCPSAAISTSLSLNGNSLETHIARD